MAISKAQVQTHQSSALYLLLSALFLMANSMWNFLDPFHYSTSLLQLQKTNKTHRKLQIIKPTRCNNFTNLFWHETLHVSDSSSVYHQEFIHCTISIGIYNTSLQTAFEQDQVGTQFLMMYRGTGRNMQSFMPK